MKSFSLFHAGSWWEWLARRRAVQFRHDANGSSDDPERPNRQDRPERPDPDPYGNRGTPPDLDEMWEDLRSRFGGLFGGQPPGPRRPPEGGSPQRGPWFGLWAIVLVAALIWIGTGFFIVQEGQQAVITQFGRYYDTVGAGFHWRLPFPFQRHEKVFVTQIRSVDVGRDTIVKATGLRDCAMLTEDENIVEVRFAVQYRLHDARAYLFESRNPGDTVVQAAETAVREVVGKMRMDSVLSDERDQIAPRVRTLMQRILDRYKVGIEVVGINLQQGGVSPPEQVQAAFDDVLKAGQEGERAKNEAQAYANDVVPRAVGGASRLREEALAYKARIVAQAQGDSQRFRAVLNEYRNAPQVTRDRMYIDAMQQVYSGVSKVLVDTRQGSSLLYLPLDKILRTPSNGAESQVAPTTVAPSVPGAEEANAQLRDALRARSRESR